MSCNYADGLSPYHDKGQLGLEERFDNNSVIAVKVEMLAKWINKAKHVVLHTGAGISTSAGIPDFRGPRGVWTLQAKGQKPDMSTDFNEAIPTPTHMAITRLVEMGKVKYVVSQNIDGLHLRSGLPRKNLSELHGNMFIEQCNACNRQFVRKTAVPSVGQKSLNKACPTIKPNGRACRGRLHDTILDWEHSLPENDLAMADFHSCMADLSIALGTTMQIVPSGSLPLYTKKAGGRLVIINLQPTKHDTKADLLIHGYSDEVMTILMKQLSLRIPKYSTKNDPTRLTLNSDHYFEWTISDAATAAMRLEYEAKCGSKEAKKRLEVIDEDDMPLIARVNNTKTPTEVTRKRKVEESLKSKSKSRKSSGDDSDVEVVVEIPRRRGRPPKSKKGRPPKSREALLITSTKLVIKKNVTPTKTKYEIVPTKNEKKPKRGVQIVHEKDNHACGDLEMLCESDDDAPISFTTNFRRYLYDDKTFKQEEKPDVELEVNTSIPSVLDQLVNQSDMKLEEDKTKDSSNIEKSNVFSKVKEDGEENSAKVEIQTCGDDAAANEVDQENPVVLTPSMGQSDAMSECIDCSAQTASKDGEVEKALVRSDESTVPTDKDDISPKPSLIDDESTPTSENKDLPISLTKGSTEMSVSENYSVSAVQSETVQNSLSLPEQSQIRHEDEEIKTNDESEQNNNSENRNDWNEELAPSEPLQENNDRLGDGSTTHTSELEDATPTEAESITDQVCNSTDKLFQQPATEESTLTEPSHSLEKMADNFEENNLKTSVSCNSATSHITSELDLLCETLH